VAFLCLFLGVGWRVGVLIVVVSNVIRVCWVWFQVSRSTLPTTTRAGLRTRGSKRVLGLILERHILDETNPR
jgi:hypothetical protein